MLYPIATPTYDLTYTTNHTHDIAKQTYSTHVEMQQNIKIS